MDQQQPYWKKAVEACIANGKRILEDAGYLAEYRCFTSAKVLGILAQEEFAKAYLLKLVDEGAIPLCDEVLRACRDHSCKHLIALVMAHLFTPFDDALERHKKDIKADELRGALGPTLPSHVADALNIFCHEKLHRWRSKNWFWAEDPCYNKRAKAVGNGKLDREKQDALYVGIGRSGLTSIPSATEAESNITIETAQMLCEVASGNDMWAFTEKEKIVSGLKLMSEGLRQTPP